MGSEDVILYTSSLVVSVHKKNTCKTFVLKMFREHLPYYSHDKGISSFHVGWPNERQAIVVF